jgi:hypothetical protein
VPIFHRQILSNRLGSGATTTAMARTIFTDAHYLRECETAHHDVLEANGRIVRGQGWLVTAYNPAEGSPVDLPEMLWPVQLVVGP